MQVIRCLLGWLALVALGMVVLEYPFLLIPVWALAGMVAFVIMFGFRPMSTSRGRTMLAVFAGIGFLGLLAVGFVMHVPNHIRRSVSPE